MSNFLGAVHLATLAHLEITIEQCSPYFSVLTLFMRKSASPSCTTFILTIMSKLP